MNSDRHGFYNLGFLKLFHPQKGSNSSVQLCGLQKLTLAWQKGSRVSSTVRGSGRELDSKKRGAEPADVRPRPFRRGWAFRTFASDPWLRLELPRGQSYVV